MKILIVCPKKDNKCGVFDYSLKMLSSLKQENEVFLITNRFNKKEIPSKIKPSIKDFLSNWKIKGFIQLLRYALKKKPDFINIQYVPFLYNKWGINPYLPIAVILLKFLGFKTLLTVHEFYVPFVNWKSIIIGIFQRIQLLFLIFFSEKSFISIEKRTIKIKKIFPFKKDIYWLPIISNISYYPIDEYRKKSIRKKFKFKENDLIITTFNPSHREKLLNEILKTWNSVKKEKKNAKLVIIGFSKEDISNYSIKFEKDICCPGYLSEKKVGELLSISHIHLVPYEDGISSRRGSAIAAMNYGLPIITTKNYATDSIFYNSPIILVDNPKRLSEKVLYLAENQQARLKVGKETKKFYEKYFALDIIKNKFLDYLK